jgi:ubiquinone/menaquinone biosynthesis C-methylase UbiE
MVSEFSTSKFASVDQIRADFDQLAAFDNESWNHNTHYHDWLLRYVPATFESALDVGCGTGAFTRALAKQSGRTVGLDLSPKMLHRAEVDSNESVRIEYVNADFLSWNASETFDVVASIATLHHMPLESSLKKMKLLLRPGGVLLVLDLYQAHGIWENFTNLSSIPYSAFLRLKHEGRIRQHPGARSAWDKHARHDVFPTMREIRSVCGRILPHAIIRRHALWRYSIVWRREP